MKYALMVVLTVLLIASPCIAKKSGDDIWDDDLDKTVALPQDQNAFFDGYQYDTKLNLKLHDDVHVISPAIGKAKNLRSFTLIESGGSLGDDGNGVVISSVRKNVTIPLELLNLPNLRTLKVYGPVNLHLPPGIHPSRIHSRIEQIKVSNWGKNSAPFLANLPKLRRLILQKSESQRLPSGFDRLQTLRELYIVDGSKPLDIGESLCGLTNLERLDIAVPLRSPLPRCLEGLTHLKSVSAASCRRETLPDQTKIYFPAVLASLPNLEELTLWEGRRIEMPDASYGFQKLRKLDIETDPTGTGDAYGIYPHCSADPEQPSHPDERYFNGLDLDAVVDYPELQEITVASDMTFKGSTVKAAHKTLKGNGDYTPYNTDGIRGIRRFLGIVDTAWKNDELPSLEQIDMWNRDNGDMATMTVWKRPSSRDESGARLHKHDVNWMTQEEQEKASSRK